MKACDTLWGYCGADQWLAESTRLHRTSWDYLFSLRNGFTAYNVISPENGSFASVVAQDNPAQLDASTAASGPHDLMSSRIFGLLKMAEALENKGIFDFCRKNKRPAETRRAPIGPSFAVPAAFVAMRWVRVSCARAASPLYGLPGPALRRPGCRSCTNEPTTFFARWEL
jgi:hypothetical protein